MRPGAERLENIPVCLLNRLCYTYVENGSKNWSGVNIKKN